MGSCLSSTSGHVDGVASARSPKQAHDSLHRRGVVHSYPPHHIVPKTKTKPPPPRREAFSIHHASAVASTATAELSSGAAHTGIYAQQPKARSTDDEPPHYFHMKVALMRSSEDARLEEEASAEQDTEHSACTASRRRALGRRELVASPPQEALAAGSQPRRQSYVTIKDNADGHESPSVSKDSYSLIREMGRYAFEYDRYVEQEQLKPPPPPAAAPRQFSKKRMLRPEAHQRHLPFRDDVLSVWSQTPSDAVTVTPQVPRQDSLTVQPEQQPAHLRAYSLIRTEKSLGAPPGQFSPSHGSPRSILKHVSLPGAVLHHGELDERNDKPAQVAKTSETSDLAKRRSFKRPHPLNIATIKQASAPRIRAPH